MAKRTDRQRVQWQADAMISALDNAITHGYKLDAINDKRSPYINDQLPKVVTGIELAKQLVTQFRKGL